MVVQTLLSPALSQELLEDGRSSSFVPLCVGTVWLASLSQWETVKVGHAGMHERCSAEKSCVCGSVGMPAP